MAPSLTCLYCQETKGAEAFNREHVLSQAFGVYPESNLVLHDTVCRACNTYFSGALELFLGRETWEGIERYKLGLKEIPTDRRVGTRLLEVKTRGGLHDGAFLEWRAQRGCPVVVPAPQLGFSSDSAGPFEWYRVKDLPPPEVLRGRGFVPGTTTIMAAGLPYEDAARLLRSLGYSADNMEHAPEPAADSAGKIAITVTGTIEQKVRRAIAKIGFNYLASQYPAISRMDVFRDIRRFIRFGEEPSIPPVAISQGSILGGVCDDQQLLVHSVVVAWEPSSQSVVARVSLFSWCIYQVLLAAPGSFRIAPTCIGSGHAFDPMNPRIVPLTRWDRAEPPPSPPMERGLW
jgi:hypothetical protein